jgi:hypothetical protein
MECVSLSLFTNPQSAAFLAMPLRVDSPEIEHLHLVEDDAHPGEGSVHPCLRNLAAPKATKGILLGSEPVKFSRANLPGWRPLYWKHSPMWTEFFNANGGKGIEQTPPAETLDAMAGRNLYSPRQWDNN